MRRASFYPKGSLLEKICVARPKYNDILNEAVARYNNNIMNVTSCNLPEHYNSQGRLTDKGKLAFWQEFDHLMERFDRNQIQLLPARSAQYEAQVRTGQRSRKFRQPTSARDNYKVWYS